MRSLTLTLHIEEVINKETNETKNITDPVKIADNFNNYFTSIAE